MIAFHYLFIKLFSGSGLLLESSPFFSRRRSFALIDVVSFHSALLIPDGWWIWALLFRVVERKGERQAIQQFSHIAQQVVDLLTSLSLMT